MICTATFHLRLIARLARTHRQDKGGVILASSSLGWRAHSDRWRSRRISERPIAVGPPPIARQALTCIVIQSASACDQRAVANVRLDAPAGDEDTGQPLRAGSGPRTPAPCAREAEEQLLSRPMRLAHSARSSRSTPVEVAGSAVASRRGAPRDIHPYCICIPSKVCILQLLGSHIRHVEGGWGQSKGATLE